MSDLAWWVLWRRRCGWASACLLLVSAGAAAACWHHCRWNLFLADELGFRACEEGRPICVEAIALTSPRWSPAPPLDPLCTIARGEQTHLALWITRVRDGAQWRSASGRTTLTIAGRLTGVCAGDRVLTFALLYAPSPPLNPGEFDFRSHHRGDRELCLLHTADSACVAVISHGRPWGLRRILGRLRGGGSRLLWRCVGRERAALASALLLGAREQLNRQETDEFLTTGTIHMLSISGLHVGILASGILLAARTGWLSRRATLCATVLFVLVYALLIDAEPPVVRASFWVAAMCCARLLGRRALGDNTLAAAAIVVLALNPNDLFQVGPQLSFMSVATLGYCVPLLWPAHPEDPLERLIARARPWPLRAARRLGGAAWRLSLTSAAIWLTTLPLVLYRFHVVALAALVLNPILWAPVAAALFSGFGVLAVGWLAPALGRSLGWICDASLSVIQTCVEAADRVQGAHFWTPGPSLGWVLVFYAVLGALAAAPRCRSPKKWCLLLMVGWISVGACVSAAMPWRRRGGNSGELVCTFLAVGHGACVVVESPDGRKLMYDAGKLGPPMSAARPISDFLWSRGIRHLDAVVISHADADHFNALPKLLERFSVGVVYVSPAMLANPSPAVAQLSRSIVAAGAPIRFVWDGTRLRELCPARVEVLHPPRAGVDGGDNANSVVLHVDFGGRTVLLAGDLEPPGLDSLLSGNPLRSDVLLAPHHGSGRSAPAALAAWSAPGRVVISGGRGRDAARATRQWAAVAPQVFHTAKSGAVQVWIGRHSLQLTTWRDDRWR